MLMTTKPTYTIIFEWVFSPFLIGQTKSLANEVNALWLSVIYSSSKIDIPSNFFTIWKNIK
jgi:hypothetical protein